MMRTSCWAVHRAQDIICQSKLHTDDIKHNEYTRPGPDEPHLHSGTDKACYLLLLPDNPRGVGDKGGTRVGGGHWSKSNGSVDSTQWWWQVCVGVWEGVS